MPRVEADRNLLLGILAHQMDFVSRDALFAAMHAWTVRKETPLGALLVERGDLASSRRDLLEALVNEHIKAHANDPARSLGALSSVGPLANDLNRLVDPDIQASINHLQVPETITPSADDDPLRTLPSDSLGHPTSMNGRFRVIRHHASGGLGVVSIAMDDELDREVAFKQIKDQYADHDNQRARFILEAEITGKLEHPGIIPIYGLGNDPTGRPFYAMRFIKGQSLAEAIRRFHDSSGPYANPTEHRLQFRELIARFLDACNAISYAHSRGVLHRDLKPNNIMLGPFGETIVVDWGLAIVMHEVPAGYATTDTPVKPTKVENAYLATDAGAIVGTPAYMPPEQAQGLRNQIGPRSDVYGLGTVLYHLLTGKHPFQGDSGLEILGSVIKGKIPPPRQVNPKVAPALAAICMKAMALRPEDRYDTPTALAADIKSWLADEPVTVHRDPPHVRLGRSARKHPAAITALIFIFSILIPGALAAYELVQRQKQITEEQFRQSREAIRNFMYIAYAPQGSASVQDLQRKIITAGQKYSEEMVRQDPKNSAIQAAVAFSHKMMASVILNNLEKYVRAKRALPSNWKADLEQVEFHANAAILHYQKIHLEEGSSEQQEYKICLAFLDKIKKRVAPTFAVVPPFKKSQKASPQEAGPNPDARESPLEAVLAALLDSKSNDEPSLMPAGLSIQTPGLAASLWTPGNVGD
jgi:serine/threonine-protein kinase